MVRTATSRTTSTFRLLVNSPTVREVSYGADLLPVHTVEAEMAVVSPRGTVLVKWNEEDVDRALRDMACRQVFALGPYDVERGPLPNDKFAARFWQPPTRPISLAMTETEYNAMLDETIHEHVAWSDRQPTAASLRTSRDFLAI